MTEFCVHTGSAKWHPMFTKCGFRTKRAAQRWLRIHAEPGEPRRIQALGSAPRRRR